MPYSMLRLNRTNLIIMPHLSITITLSKALTLLLDMEWPHMVQIYPIPETLTLEMHKTMLGMCQTVVTSQHIQLWIIISVLENIQSHRYVYVYKHKIKSYIIISL